MAAARCAGPVSTETMLWAISSSAFSRPSGSTAVSMRKEWVSVAASSD